MSTRREKVDRILDLIRSNDFDHVLNVYNTVRSLYLARFSRRFTNNLYEYAGGTTVRDFRVVCRNNHTIHFLDFFLRHLERNPLPTTDATIAGPALSLSVTQPVVMPCQTAVTLPISQPTKPRLMSYLAAAYNGASPHAALLKACHTMNSSWALRLIEQGSYDPKPGDEILDVACSRGLSDVALALIATGKSNPSVVSSKGNTALIHACRLEMTKVALALINTNDANPSYVSSLGNTALNYACNQRLTDVALALIATNNCNLNHVDSNQKTALILAVEKRLSTVAVAIVSSDEWNPPDVTASLSHVIQNRMADVAMAIISLKASTFREHQRGYLAQTAMDYGMADIVLALARSGEIDAVVLLNSIQMGTEQLTLSLIELGKTRPSLLRYRSDAWIIEAVKFGNSDRIFTALFEATPFDKIDMQKVISQQPRHKDLVIETVIRHGTVAQQLKILVNNVPSFMKMLADIPDVAALVPSTIQSLTCPICLQPAFAPYQHSCGIYFHKECMEKAISHKLGDVVAIDKLGCPNCRREVTDFPFGRISGYKYLSPEFIGKLDGSKIHKVCLQCANVFECAPEEGCGQDRTILPDRCQSCKFKLIICPNCGLELEHAGGCRDFRCCRYGAEECSRRGIACDHGSLPAVRFCGHRWTISEDLRYESRRQQDSDSSSDDQEYRPRHGDSDWDRRSWRSD